VRHALPLAVFEDLEVLGAQPADGLAVALGDHDVDLDKLRPDGRQRDRAFGRRRRRWSLRPSAGREQGKHEREHRRRLHG
jgi:hypothetical protein